MKILRRKYITLLATSALMMASLSGCKGNTEQQHVPGALIATSLDQSICKKSTILVLFDRTTKLSQEGKDAALKGFKALLAQEDLNGQSYLIEIGDRAFHQKELDSTCLPALQKSAYHPHVPAFSDSRTKAEMDELENKTEQYSKARRIFNNCSASRGALFTKIEALTESDEEVHSSAIAAAIVEEIGLRCGGVADCRIIIFSDMLDTTIDGLRSGKATKDAPDFAGDLLRKLGPSIPPKSLHVVIWGIGRDDRGTGADLSVDATANVTAYWKQFFASLSVKSSDIEIRRII